MPGRGMTRTDKSSIGDRSSAVKTCPPNPAFSVWSIPILPGVSCLCSPHSGKTIVGSTLVVQPSSSKTSPEVIAHTVCLIWQPPAVPLSSLPVESPNFPPSNFQFGLVKLEHICYKLIMILDSLSPHQLFHAPFAVLEQPSGRSCFLSFPILLPPALFVPLFLLNLLIEPRSISLFLIPSPLSPILPFVLFRFFTPIQSSPTSPNCTGLKVRKIMTIPARLVIRRV